MENRIQINGIWYVREESSKPSNTEVKFDKEEVTNTRSCIYETDKYCWEASILVEEDDVLKCRTFGAKVNYLLTIKFTDKLTESSKEDYWDSMDWFEGVIENNPESLKEFDGVMDEESIKIFQKFLEYLKNDLGWL